jgi:hypothetical protein
MHRKCRKAVAGDQGLGVSGWPGGYKVPADWKNFLRGFSVVEFLWVKNVNGVSDLVGVRMERSLQGEHCNEIC